MNLQSIVNSRQTSDLLLLLFLSADIFLIFIYILHGLQLRTSFDLYELLADGAFSLKADRGVSESYQYIKELWLAILFLLLIVKDKRGAGIYTALSFLFFVLLMDDMLSFHERFGLFFEHQFQNQSILGFHSKYIGELIFAAILGGIFFLVAGIVYLRSDHLRRLHARYFVFLLALLAVFGVVLDLLFTILPESSIVSGFSAIVEDGGEMVVMSVMLWTAFRLFEADEIVEFQFLPFLRLKKSR